MKSIARTVYAKITVLFYISMAKSDKLEDLFANCRIADKHNFDNCLKSAFNRLNPIFKYGLPEYNVLPFDPHKQSYVGFIFLLYVLGAILNCFATIFRSHKLGETPTV